MSMLLLDAFDRSRVRGTLASRGSRADTRCRIVTTFGAGGSGAPGVLTQSLGISGRLEWLSGVCKKIKSRKYKNKNTKKCEKIQTPQEVARVSRFLSKFR